MATASPGALRRMCPAVRMVLAIQGGILLVSGTIVFFVMRWTMHEESQAEFLATFPPEQRAAIEALERHGIDVNRYGERLIVSNSSMGFVAATDDDLRLISALPTVESICLQNASLVTSDGLRSLSGLKTLERLDLAYSQVGDDGLRHLSGLTQLQYVGLLGSEVQGDGLGSLAGLPHLRSLSLAQSPVRQGLDRLTNRSLTDLALSGTQIDDRALTAIAANLPELTSLCVDETRVTSRGFEVLARLKRLTRLSAAATSIDDSGVAPLGSCPEMFRLTLEKTAVTGIGFATFHNQRLCLNLKSCPLSQRGMRTLANLPNLDCINLEQVPLTEESIALLARCPKLRSISLGHTQLPRTGIRRLLQKIPGYTLQTEIMYWP